MISNVSMTTKLLALAFHCSWPLQSLSDVYNDSQTLRLLLLTAWSYRCEWHKWNVNCSFKQVTDAAVLETTCAALRAITALATFSRGAAAAACSLILLVEVVCWPAQVNG